MGFGLSQYGDTSGSSSSSSDSGGGLFSRRRDKEKTPTINQASKAYIRDLQADRAAGTLGMSEAQKDTLTNRAMGTAGAATQSMLAQMPASGDAAQQQALMRTAASGLQNTAAQASANADLASEQQAANRAAELAAQEQALFQRRQANRQFALDVNGQAIEGLGYIADIVPWCWVAVALWGECERTQMARLHCRLSRGRFYDAYRTHGRAWAAWLNAHPWAKPLVAPIWHYLAWRGKLRVADAVAFAKRRHA